MRLIDVDELPNYKLNTTVEVGEHKGPAEIRIVFWKDIEKAPTIDAVPVVHARWACDEDFNTVCTGCGKRIPTFHCYNEETDEEWDEPIDKTPFCPNCGAKMDGGAAN